MIASSSTVSCHSLVALLLEVVCAVCRCDVVAVAVVGSGIISSAHTASICLYLLTVDHTSVIMTSEVGGVNVANIATADHCGPDISGETIAPVTVGSATYVSSDCVWSIVSMLPVVKILLMYLSSSGTRV